MLDKELFTRAFILGFSISREGFNAEITLNERSPQALGLPTNTIPEDFLEVEPIARLLSMAIEEESKIRKITPPWEDIQYAKRKLGKKEKV